MCGYPDWPLHQWRDAGDAILHQGCVSPARERSAAVCVRAVCVLCVCANLWQHNRAGRICTWRSGISSTRAPATTRIARRKLVGWWQVDAAPCQPLQPTSFLLSSLPGLLTPGNCVAALFFPLLTLCLTPPPSPAPRNFAPGRYPPRVLCMYGLRISLSYTDHFGPSFFFLSFFSFSALARPVSLREKKTPQHTRFRAWRGART